MHAYVGVYACACRHTCMHVHVGMLASAHTHFVNTHTHGTHACINKHTCVQLPTHTHTHTYTHTHQASLVHRCSHDPDNLWRRRRGRASEHGIEILIALLDHEFHCQSGHGKVKPKAI